MERFEINKAYEDFKSRLNALNNVLQIPNLQNTIIKNEEIMSSETFWDDAKKATTFVQKNNEMKETIEKYNSLISLNEELEVIKYKIENNIPILDNSREAIMLEKNINKIKDPKFKKYYKDVLEGYLKASKDMQKDILENKI